MSLVTGRHGMYVTAVQSTQTVLEERKEFRIVKNLRRDRILRRWQMYMHVVERM